MTLKEDRIKLYKEKKLMYDLAKNFEGVSETDARLRVDCMFEIEEIK
jgi:hypothetical protein